MTRTPQPVLRPPLSPRTSSDPEVDRVLRDHTRLLTELSLLPMTFARIVPDVSLPDATNVPVKHGLGREPRWIGPSCARQGTGLTGGQIVEVLDGSIDRRDMVVLRAVGFGATVTADVLFL